MNTLSEQDVIKENSFVNRGGVSISVIIVVLQWHYMGPIRAMESRTLGFRFVQI